MERLQDMSAMVSIPNASLFSAYSPSSTWITSSGTGYVTAAEILSLASFSEGTGNVIFDDSSILFVASVALSD